MIAGAADVTIAGVVGAEAAMVGVGMTADEVLAAPVP